MRLTYYGHSCVGVSTGSAQLLFDPFITGNPLAKGVDVGTIPATHILITHGHGDHLMDAEVIAKRTNAMVITNHEIANWFSAKGVKECTGLNLGGRGVFGGFAVKMTTAHHSSSFPDGSYAGNPGGFVVTTSEGSFHHAGDTALTLDMQLLKRHALTFACLPIGDLYTMGVEDAIEAAQFMGVKTVVGIHYDSFPPITIDRAGATAQFGKAGLQLLLPAIGTTIDL